MGDSGQPCVPHTKNLNSCQYACNTLNEAIPYQCEDNASPISVLTCSEIPQLDGNISLLSDSSHNQSFCRCCQGQPDIGADSDCDQDQDNGQPIPVVCDLPPTSVFSNPPPWYEEHIPTTSKKQNKDNIVRVSRDNRQVMGESLPVIAVSNMRSLRPKLNSYKTDLIEREIAVSLICEVWEKVGCRKQIYEMEKMLQLDGLKYISTPRTTKRGGGAAIVVNLEKFSLEKIDVIIPYNLEVVWGLMRPRKMTSKIKEFIVGSFYSPPHSKKNSKLLDHLISTVHFLLSKYPNAGVILGGDKNDLSLSTLLSGIPKLKQLVTKPTHKSKILDVILTNMHGLYSVPIIAPPVLPDDPNYGVASDHSTPIATPLAQQSSASGGSREYVTRTYRPLPESGLREFGEWICGEDWGGISENIAPSKQVLEFENIITSKLNSILPTKSIKINPFYDKPYITAELKKLDRMIKRTYRRQGKSKKYISLKKCYDEKMVKAAEAYLNENVRSLKEDNPGRAYKSLKKMSAQPGDLSDEGNFTLISHMEANLTTEQSIEKIAQHFSNISQEFPPLTLQSLPDDVISKIHQPVELQDLPVISDHTVYEKIKRSKKPRSSVPGDLPRRVVQEFAPELAAPASKIFRNITQTGHWPESWKVEYGTPLQKTTDPISEDDLRIISLTPYLSKVYEQFVMGWLLEYVSNKLDWGQYGGKKGSSISHYLIDFVNFILYNQDLKIPQAVLAVLIDYSKAFNRANHNLIVTILSSMGVPGWLLRIVIGFLTKRELIVRYKGKNSGRKAMPGGTPQGTILGLFLFLIIVNSAGYLQLEKNLSSKMTQSLNKRIPMPYSHMKYIDDLSLVKSLNLRECLITNTNPTRPVTYHNRTHHILPATACDLQLQLDRLHRHSQEHEMQINQNKSKVMIFNTARNFDVMPNLTLPGMGVGESLEVVEKYKLNYLVL